MSRPWPVAWDVNPPRPGDPEYDAYMTARPGEGERLRRLAEATRPPGLTAVGHVPMPDVPAEEQRKLARMMVDALADPSEPSWRTLGEIPDDPPRPLLLGILEPDGPSLCYAAPGVGKGTSGAHWIVELQRLGMRPAIYDAERRPREWARRVSGLGGDRAGVVYIEPADLGRRYAGKPLWEAAPAIEGIVKAAGVDVLFVDSILPAVGVGEERLRSDAQAPFLFVSALDSMGIPSVSFGHPPKGQPEGDPFGSMGWLAAMRLTWLGTRAEGDEHRVRWRPRKRNERGHLAGVLLTFGYGDDGRPCSVTREDDEESTRDWLLAALVRGPRSVSDLADEIAEESDDHVTADGRDRAKARLSKTLRRMARDGSVTRDGPATGRGVKWSLVFHGGTP